MSAMVPAQACAIQEFMQRFEMDFVGPSSYQSPVTHAAKPAYDAATYYEQLALMLEAENLAFQMAKVPPGLEFIMPPPGLEPEGFGGSCLQLVNNATEKMTRQICWFQNRYHHAKPGDNASPCSRGDDCQFCHAFHPKLSRRDGPKSLCSCTAHFMKQQQRTASDSASTRDDDCSLETSSSDESSNVPSSNGRQVTPPVPTPEVPRPQSQRTANKNKIHDLKVVDSQADSTEPPPMLRQICYFQNRWHNRQEGEDAFDPCSKGDDCVHCHEIHPLIKRRNDKSSRCTCPIKSH
eukprot:TRINITY_DN17634_c0_g1_i1.p1 TRINITY_DN17634_c0_g1~~TRINITY_DN17634_c0_g1_i1.p1  ORF type:complete len:328 (+),score=58.04 TRINITY_DN17634_c0_g1_i1:108-986(+)